MTDLGKLLFRGRATRRIRRSDSCAHDFGGSNEGGKVTKHSAQIGEGTKRHLELQILTVALFQEIQTKRDLTKNKQTCERDVSKHAGP